MYSTVTSRLFWKVTISLDEDEILKEGQGRRRSTNADVKGTVSCTVQSQIDCFGKVPYCWDEDQTLKESQGRR